MSSPDRLEDVMKMCLLGRRLPGLYAPRCAPTGGERSGESGLPSAGMDDDELPMYAFDLRWALSGDLIKHIKLGICVAPCVLIT